MAPYIPADSLYHRYNEAYRKFTWQGIWGTKGLKILSHIRTQTAPTCIYEAISTWMECYLRLAGIIVRISAKDLQEKEQALMSEQEDRTLRCMEVLMDRGVCSEEDYAMKNPYGRVYRLNGYEPFTRFEQGYRQAVQRMEESPLLIVFKVGENYTDYVLKYGQRPILSYERKDEGRWEGHGACGIAYGVESVVPFWEFMNSCGKIGPTKGFGRVLPENVYHVIAPRGVHTTSPLNPKKRKRHQFADWEADAPTPKKLKWHGQ